MVCVVTYASVEISLRAAFTNSYFLIGGGNSFAKKNRWLPVFDLVRASRCALLCERATFGSVFDFITRVHSVPGENIRQTAKEPN